MVGSMDVALVSQFTAHKDRVKLTGRGNDECKTKRWYGHGDEALRSARDIAVLRTVR